MSQKIIISSVTANTPVDIYYCDSMSANCIHVSTVSVFPYEFYVPPPYDETNIVIKVMDNQSCVYSKTIFITPTPTPTNTKTPTPTITTTKTSTPTPSITPSFTPTNTQTPSLTPTNTPTQTSTPVISAHLVGKSIFSVSGSVCSDTVSSTNLYTYISQANLTPVSGATIYQNTSGGVLYDPVLYGFSYIKLKFGNDFYVVQVNPNGEIIAFEICP